MRKINLMLTIIIGVLSISCGQNVKEKIKQEEESENNSACQIADLRNVKDWKNIHLKGVSELYSGTAIEKDQFDTIIRKINIKNGWITKQIWKDKINNEYVITANYEYENARYTNGFEILLFNDDEFKYVSSMIEKKNGKIFNKWKIDLTNSRQCNISTISEFKNGKSIFSDSSQVAPKCMPNANFDYYYGSYNLKDISPELFNKTLDDLKKEFPGFRYWKN